MRQAPLTSPYASQLSRNNAFLIGESRVEARERRELDGNDAEINRFEAQQRIAFDRERENVRCRVECDLQVVIDGVSGIVPPGDLIERAPLPPSVFELIKSAPNRSTPKLFHPVPCIAGVPSVDTLRPLQGKAKDSREQNVIAELPLGFPVPFEASGFRCVRQWAETSFREVLVTALGPQSQRERRSPMEPPNRLLLSVACYLLNEVVSRESRMETLWPILRRVIFGGVFLPASLSVHLGKKCKPVKELEENHGGNNADSCPPYPSFESPRDFLGQRLWSSAFTESQKKGMELTERVFDLQEVVRKNRLVLRYAQRRIEGFRIAYAFRAWRKVVARILAFREAATAYLKRVHQRIRVEGSFIRWRRIAVRTHASMLSRLVKDLELRLAMHETNHNRIVENLKKQVEEEQRNNKILKLREESLKAQLGESHVDALRLLHAEVRRKQTNLHGVKKNARRWERLAKTFTLSDPCVRVPKALRRIGLALQRMEDDFALDVPKTGDRVAEVRRCLEVFLLDWVNFVMKNYLGSSAWRSVVRIDIRNCNGYFGGSALLQLVRALVALYVSRGAKRVLHKGRRTLNKEDAPVSQEAQRPEDDSFDTLYPELCWLLSLQTMEGLYPSLLMQCHELEKFFTPELFCRRPHSTAMLWILSTLFLGYTRLVTGGYAIAEQNVDTRLRCRDESQIGISFLSHLDLTVLSTLDGARGRSSIVALDTAVHKTPAKPPKPLDESENTQLPPLAPGPTQMMSSMSQLSSSAERALSEPSAGDGFDHDAVDTLSDLELYLGLDKGAAPDENGASPQTKDDDDDDEYDDENGEVEAGETETTESPNGDMTTVSSEEIARWQRVRRREHVLPPVSASLSGATHRKFVTAHDSDRRRRRMWLGLARVVSSLVTRCRVLDVVEPVETPVLTTRRRHPMEVPRRSKRRMPSRMTQESVPLALVGTTQHLQNLSRASHDVTSEENTSSYQSILKGVSK